MTEDVLGDTPGEQQYLDQANAPGSFGPTGPSGADTSGTSSVAPGQSDLLMRMLSGAQPSNRAEAVLQNLYASPMGAAKMGGPLLAMIMGLTGTPVPAMTRTAGGVGVPYHGGPMAQLLDMMTKIQQMRGSEAQIGLAGARTAKTRQDIAEEPEKQALEERKVAATETWRNYQKQMEGARINAMNSRTDVLKEGLKLRQDQTKITNDYTKAKMDALQSKDPGFNQAVSAIRTMPPGSDRNTAIHNLFTAYFEQEKNDPNIFQSFIQWFSGAPLNPKFTPKRPVGQVPQGPPPINPQAADALGNIINKYLPQSPVQ